MRAVFSARLFTPTPKDAKRFFEFFSIQINYDHTLKAYMNAARRFAQWSEARGIKELATGRAVQNIAASSSSLRTS